MKTANVKLSELRRVIEATLTGKSLNREEKFAYLLGMRSLAHIQCGKESRMYVYINSCVDDFYKLTRGEITRYNIHRDEFLVKSFGPDELQLAKDFLKNFFDAQPLAKHQTAYLDAIYEDYSAETVDTRSGEL